MRQLLLLKQTTCKPMLAWLGSMLLLILSAPVFAAAVVENIEFSALPGDKIEIKMSFDAMPPAPTGYTIEQPARIALDLMDVKSTLSSKYHSLGSGNARSVTVVEAADRTRVIVALTELVGYSTRIDGNALYILVGAEGQAQTAGIQPSAPSSSSSASYTGPIIQEID